MRFASVRNVHTEAKCIRPGVFPGNEVLADPRAMRLYATIIEPRLHTVDAWSKTKQPARRIAYIRISKNA